MKNNLEQLHQFHLSRLGHLLFGIAELAIAYGMASWSIYSGQWWQYLLTFLFIYGGIRNLLRILFRRKDNGHEPVKE